MPKPQPIDWTEAFLNALAKVPNITAAARAAGISRRGAYDRREADPEFAAAWDDALEQSTDALVGAAYRRAFEGTEEPVFYQGEECGMVRRFSDRLAMFLLKAHRPQVYGDKSQVEMSGPDGGPIPVAIEQAIEKIYGIGDKPDGG